MHLAHGHHNHDLFTRGLKANQGHGAPCVRLEILGMTAVYRHNILQVRVPESLVPYFRYAVCRHKLHRSFLCLMCQLMLPREITAAPGELVHHLPSQPAQIPTE